MPALTAARRALATLAFAIAAAAAAALPVLTASPASAHDEPGGAAVQVQPQSSCVVVNHDRSYAMVLGYTNPGAEVSIARGPQNKLTGVPAGPGQGVQPTQFATGSHPAVFTVFMEAGTRGSWTVAGRSTTIAVDAAPRCGQGYECPADGNGLAAVIVAGLTLLAAGAVLTVRRLRRAR